MMVIIIVHALYSKEYFGLILYLSIWPLADIISSIMGLISLILPKVLKDYTYFTILSLANCITIVVYVIYFE